MEINTSEIKDVVSGTDNAWNGRKIRVSGKNEC